MRWAHGFSQTAESFLRNYTAAIDAASRYGVELIVIWGFLRDKHGGIETARRIREYAGERGVHIMPGVGIDDYGGVYYEGDSPYSLDTFIRAHPECQARNKDGTPATHLWPATDKTARLKGCPSSEALIGHYIESVEWLLKTFDLDAFQIEQGDSGLCYCDRCLSRARVVAGEAGSEHNDGYQTSVTDGAERIGRVVSRIESLAADPERFRPGRKGRPEWCSRVSFVGNSMVAKTASRPIAIPAKRSSPSIRRHRLTPKQPQSRDGKLHKNGTRNQAVNLNTSNPLAMRPRNRRQSMTNWTPLAAMVSRVSTNVT